MTDMTRGQWAHRAAGLRDMTAPSVGFKQSGNSRDTPLHALDTYTELKAAWIEL